MKQRKRKDDGFTLIELMIVIAVIGILAVVLIPKIGNVKTLAKATGVQTNFQSVSAAVQSITDLTASNANLSNGSNSVYTELTTYFSGTNAMTNPFTNVSSYSNGVANIGYINYVANYSPPTVNNLPQAPVAVVLGDNNQPSVNSPGSLVSLANAGTVEQGWAGMIVVDPYVDSAGVVNVGIVGYDNQGKPIKNLVNTLQP